MKHPIWIVALAALLGASFQEGKPDEKLDEKKARELIEKLDSNEVDVRTQAEGELNAMGEGIVPLLEKARTGASSETRARLDTIIGEITLARKWLKDLSAEEQEAMQAYSRLEQSLRGKNLDRRQAARILNAALLSDAVSENIKHSLYSAAERYRINEIWPTLIQLMGREDSEGQYAISYLQRLKPPKEAVDEILKALPKVKSRSNITQILELVAKMKPDRAKLDPVIQSILEDTDESSAYTIASYITQGRLQVSLKTVLRCWKGSRNARQSLGRDAILRVPPDDSVKELIEWLGTQDWEDVMLAADYVARHKVVQAAVPIVEALQKQASDERTGIGSPYFQGGRRIYYASGDPNQAKTHLVQALRTLGAEELIKQWLSAGGPPSRSALLGLIGDLELKSLSGEVLAGLEDKDPAVRKTAARTLATLPHPDAGAKLEARLKDDSIPVRKAALQSLAQLRGSAATALVLEQLRSDKPDVQAAAVELLPAMNLEVVLDELTKEASLGGSMTRYALAYLIVQQGDTLLHRVMARLGGKISADDLNAMMRLIQTARGQRY